MNVWFLLILLLENLIGLSQSAWYPKASELQREWRKGEDSDDSQTHRKREISWIHSFLMRFIRFSAIAGTEKWVPFFDCFAFLFYQINTPELTSLCVSARDFLYKNCIKIVLKWRKSGGREDGNTTNNIKNSDEKLFWSHFKNEEWHVNSYWKILKPLFDILIFYLTI